MEGRNITNHVGLMEAILAGEVTRDMLFAYLREAGYKGPQGDTIGVLFFAFEDTNAYVTGNWSRTDPFETITQSEYFEMLAESMNKLV